MIDVPSSSWPRARASLMTVRCQKLISYQGRRHDCKGRSSAPVHRKRHVILGDLWVCLFPLYSCTQTTAHTRTGGWARTHRTQYAQGIFSDLCRFGFLPHTTGAATPTRSYKTQMASRLGSPKNHVQKRIMPSDLMSWQLWHISTEATHLVSFFWDMLQSLTEVYLLVYFLQSSATHCQTMMSQFAGWCKIGHLFLWAP